VVAEKRGTCHCGAVEFIVRLESGLQNIRRCNCSLCRRKGAIMATVPLDRLRVTRGADKLTLYHWNTRTAEHYFCSICGIYTHQRRRSNPNEYNVNIACLDGVDHFAFTQVPVVDGASLSPVQ
jgi:hypothetical protein